MYIKKILKTQHSNCVDNKALIVKHISNFFHIIFNINFSLLFRLIVDWSIQNVLQCFTFPVFDLCLYLCRIFHRDADFLHAKLPHIPLCFHYISSLPPLWYHGHYFLWFFLLFFVNSCIIYTTQPRIVVSLNTMLQQTVVMYYLTFNNLKQEFYILVLSKILIYNSMYLGRLIVSVILFHTLMIIF